MLFAALSANAQEMTVKSMVYAPTDVTGNLSENLHQDLNGEYGGLVKVMIAAQNVEFEGFVLEHLLHGAGEYWVFMAKDSKHLKIRVPGYLPLDVNFRDYGIEGIRSRCTYVLTFTLPQTGQSVQQDDGMRFLAIQVEPKNSTVLVDGNPQTVENGEMSVLLPRGRHHYQVIAPGYTTEEGDVDLGDNTSPLTISLKSTKATLSVECATAGSQIYVNDQQRGVTPWSGTINAGNYTIEARLDGYRPHKTSLSLGESENRTVKIPALEVITGTLSVDCRPIGSEVYVDGKKVGTTPNIFRDIIIGNHRVEIRKEGYETLTKTVTIKENQQTDPSGEG